MNIRTQIYLPEELHRRLRERAAESGKSMAGQIREALQRYLDETEAAIPKPDDHIHHAVDVGVKLYLATARSPIRALFFKALNSVS